MTLPDPETCTALARAVVDAGRWRWLPGMLATGDAGDDQTLTGRVIEVWGVPVVWERLSAPSQPIRGRLTALSGALPDFTDPLTAAGAQTVAEIVHNDPTLHLVPVSIDRYEDAEPVTCWRIERMIDGETEWLRESGAWGAMEQGHRDPPICCKTKLEALIAAILAAPGKS